MSKEVVPDSGGQPYLTGKGPLNSSKKAYNLTPEGNCSNKRARWQWRMRL